MGKLETQMMKIELSREHQTLAKEIQVLAKENVYLCYQCRRCSLGCPSAHEMSLKPHEMMRALQLGLEREVFESGMIWMCLSCETCNTRCPQDINILKIIDLLRELTMRGRVNYYNPYPEIPAMHRLVLKQVERYGRIQEARLAFIMNLKMVDPFRDIDLIWPLLAKRKLKIGVNRSNGMKQLGRVVSKVREIEGER